MSFFLEELKKIIQDLKTLQANWALVGGLACSIYAEPRTTKDIDLVLALSEKAQLDEIVNKMLKLGYHNKQVLMHLNPAHRLGLRVSLKSNKDYAIPIDLLTATCGIEQEIVENSKSIEILPSIVLPVAMLSHILAMKILSQNNHERIRDRADAISLISNASNEDLQKTRKALSLITERKFNRDKDLLLEFETLLESVKNNPNPKIT